MKMKSRANRAEPKLGILRRSKGSINVFPAGAGWNWVSLTGNQNLWWMYFPTRGSFMGEWLFPLSSPFYPKGLTWGLEQSKNSGHTFVRTKKHPFCLRASTFTTDSFYCTTLNMKRSILKRKKDPRKKKQNKTWIPHLTIVLRPGDKRCTLFNTRHRVSSEMYQGSEALWRTMTHVFI